MRPFIFFLVFLIPTETVLSQVNDQQAYLLGVYDKVFIRTNKVDTVKVKSDVGGKTINRHFAFDSAGNLIYSSTVNRTGKTKHESHSQFNLLGERIFYKTIDFEKSESDSICFEQVYNGNKLVKESSSQGYLKEYFYNERGQLQKTINTNEEKIVAITLHSYDSFGHDIEHIWLQNDNKMVAKKLFDNLDRLIEYKEFSYGPNDSVGKLFLHKKLIYGANGKIAKEEYLGGYFDLDKDKEEYTYNQQGRLVKYMKGKDQQIFIYNSKGYLIKKVAPLFDGSMQSVETYNYTFRK